MATPLALDVETRMQAVKNLYIEFVTEFVIKRPVIFTVLFWAMFFLILCSIEELR